MNKYYFRVRAGIRVVSSKGVVFVITGRRCQSHERHARLRHFPHVAQLSVGFNSLQQILVSCLYSVLPSFHFIPGAVMTLYVDNYSHKVNSYFLSFYLFSCCQLYRSIYLPNFVSPF